MKACILTIVDRSRLSMTSAYTDYFRKHGIDYDIIFYDKFHEYEPPYDSHLIPIRIECGSEGSSLKKSFLFYKQRKKIRSILDNGKYDLIVVWNEVTTFIYGGMLRRFFSGKYTINIRDYFYLDKPFVRSELKKTIKKCAFATVSSKRFIDYLPKHEYIFLHSMNDSILSQLEKPKSKAINRPIRIEYIGQIGWLENTFQFLDILGNDSRFELLFYGIGSEKVEEYAKERNYNNIRVRGKFPQEKTAEYLKEADILYNLYGYGNIHLDSALSIKLYYAIFLGIPILTYAGTCTDDIACQCGIGYTIHGSEGIKHDLEKLYEWYQQYNLERAQSICANFIDNEIEKSKALFQKRLTDYMEGLKND